MKVLSFVFIALSSFAAFAASTNDQELIKFGNKMMTRAQARDLVRRAGLVKTGGHVRRENTAKGYFALLNSQKTISAIEFEKVMATLDRQLHIQTKILNDDNVALDNIKAKIVGAGAALGVAVVDGGAFPALLNAPEEGWAIVNVAKLAVDKPSPEKLAERVRREVLRSFAYIAGGMCAAQGDFLMQPIVSVRDIDTIKREEFAAVLLNILPMTLPYYGITPWYQRTYAKALEEGWAPAPKDKYQQALWDKVHAMPTEPLKIKPETKKVEK